MGNQSSSNDTLKRTQRRGTKETGQRRMSFKRLSRRKPKQNPAQPFPAKATRTPTTPRAKQPQDSPVEGMSPRDREFNNLVEKLEEFYTMYEPSSLESGLVNCEEIAEWTLSQEDGYHLLYEELFQRFGTGLDEFLKSSPGAPVARPFAATTYSSLDEFDETEDLPPPPPPLTPETEHMLEKLDEERRSVQRRSFMLDTGAIDLYHDDSSEADSFVEPSQDEIDEMKELLRRFLLLYNPSTPLSEYEELMDEYVTKGRIPLDATLLELYGHNITTMEEEERLAQTPARKESFQEKFGVKVHNDEVLSQVTLARKLNTSKKPPAPQRKESYVSDSLERKWQQRKASTMQRSSLPRRGTFDDEDDWVCSKYRLDMEAAEFGACAHCGKKKHQHSTSARGEMARRISQRR